ncbi:MurR/RpiR family transcriptional regulator [Anaerobacillus sp. CMMVII]|uniref:MurR/RpiR family transcriptional regulator n=1 Tax=Anaerobacillus sp. CMMVII TaxID=2755588 RepID=UPI0021B7B128|nr:MurR/RpiR family transcriptional regulator [Anaerobacillus sp. CMMVII]MCT8139202.1 MurR/RpiR family transcriptional regulator [Anaerobacillus sp. CMMVII]
MEQKTLTSIIKENFSALSVGQKKVAEYLMLHQDESALLTAYQIGRRVGVSETTVIRFAYALGFSGFSQMQESIRKDWLTNKQAMAGEGDLAEKECNDEDKLFTAVVDQEKLLLQQLLHQVNTEDLWKAVDQLIAADRIFIGGIGSSYAAGYWFYYTLNQLRENVFISNPTGFLTEDLCELTENSVVVIFSFPRYRKETVELANLVQKVQAKIIAITNRQLSPVGQVAALTLTTEEQMESGHHSIASVISLLEIIIAGIHKRDHDRIRKRLQKLELLYNEQELFLE